MKTANCGLQVQQTVEQAIPLTFRAVGQEGPAQITCLRREVCMRGCTSVVVAEFLVEVPVRLSVTADCDDCDSASRTEVTCTASGLVAVELPLALGVGHGDDEGESSRMILTPVVTAGCTLAQALQVALPLTVGITATSGLASASC